MKQINFKNEIEDNFSRMALNKIYKKFGYEIKKKSTNWSPDLLLLTGERNETNDSIVPMSDNPDKDSMIIALHEIIKGLL